MGVFSPAHSRIRIIKLELPGVDSPVVCQQCEKPRCVKACVPKAIVPNPVTGILEINPDLCIHCMLCTLACPYGAISVTPGDRETRQLLKCDLCGGTPNCVYWCDTGAISFVEGTETQRLKSSAENMILLKQRFQIENTDYNEDKS
jgi:Fe-S-cluster-containing hydrogenase component 2